MMVKLEPWYVIAWRLPWFVIFHAAMSVAFLTVLLAYGRALACRFWKESV